MGIEKRNLRGTTEVIEMNACKREREKEDRSNGTPLQLIASEKKSSKNTQPPKKAATSKQQTTQKPFFSLLLQKTAKNPPPPFFFGAYQEYFFENLPRNKRGIGISAGAYFDLGVEPKSHIGA